jgi:hypothetical protein
MQTAFQKDSPIAMKTSDWTLYDSAVSGELHRNKRLSWVKLFQISQIFEDSSALRYSSKLSENAMLCLSDYLYSSIGRQSQKQIQEFVEHLQRIVSRYLCERILNIQSATLGSGSSLFPQK